MTKKSKQKPVGSIFKVVTVYPQATVRRVAYVRGSPGIGLEDLKKDLEDEDFDLEKWAKRVDIDIDYRGEAYTESVTQVDKILGKRRGVKHG